MKKDIGKFLFFFPAFVFRLILAPIYHHEDADSFFYWAKYLWDKKDLLFFLGKSVPNAVRANYPPLSYYIMFIWRGFYELVGRLMWLVNVNFSFFPSNLIPWYQSYQIGVAFNKIPAILADLTCALLIYKIIEQIDEKSKINVKLRKIAVFSFLFLPATWYNSSIWGQTDSIYCCFLLMCFYLILKGCYLWAVMAMLASILTKPLGLFVSPVLMIYFLKKKKILDLAVGLLFALFLSLILFFPFYPIDTIRLAINYYIGNFQGQLNNLVYNSFNIWELLFGFEKVPSADTQILFVSVSVWGKTIFSIFLFIVCYWFWKKSTKVNLILASFLCSFSAFLFLPKMHERYFYPSLVLLAILAGLRKNWFKLFFILTLVHFLNLYRFWWFPRMSFLVSLLSNLMVVRSIILINIIVFFLFLSNLKKNDAFNNNR